MKYSQLTHRLPLVAADSDLTICGVLGYLETLEEVVTFIFSLFDTLETVVLGFLEAAISMRDSFCSDTTE